MRLYIAGPMSGIESFNYPAFAKASADWHEQGWDILDPSARFNGRTDLPYEVYINHSMIDVVACDAIAVLPNWEQSKGATLEVLYARVAGKPVYDAEHPARSDSSSLRAASGGLRPPERELRQDSPPVDGLPR